MMALTPSSLTSSPPDLGTILQQAITALAQVIESRPASDRLLAEMVRLSGQALRAGGAAVWVTEQPDTPQLILEHNLASLQLLSAGAGQTGNPASAGGPDAAQTAGGRVITGVTNAVRRCAREAKPLIVPPFFLDQETPGGSDAPVNPSPLELLFVPMKMHAKVALVLMMAVPPPPHEDTGLHRTWLNFLARMIAAVEQDLAGRQLSLIEKDRGISNKLVRFADQVHKHLFLGQVAVDIANLVRDVMAAQRVTVQLHPRLRKSVLAVSNVDEPNRRANVFQVQRLVLDYVRDRQVPVILDRNAARQLVSDPVLQDAATAYFAATEFNAFLAAPIKTDDPTAPVLGVILVEYSATDHAQAQSALLGDVTRLCTSSVQNAIDVESVPFARTFHAIRRLWGGGKKPAGSKRVMALAIGGLVLIAATVLGTVPFDFAIKADCQIRPGAQLSIVAPVEERIIELPVRAGEHVYPKGARPIEGQHVKPLAVFDATDLVTQRADSLGKKGELEVQLKDAQRKGDMTKIGALQKQLEQAQRTIELLDHQIDQCTVWSPIEGTVLTENVEQKRWSTPRKSDPLMEVASFSDWQLVVDVPESEVATVRQALEKASHGAAIDGKPDPGIEVEYILYPWPDRRYSIHAKGVATLLPASTQIKTANVFRLQVKLDPADLPPGIALSGVTGRAKIHVGTMPLAQQWTRGALRLLKMSIFF